MADKRTGKIVAATIICVGCIIFGTGLYFAKKYENIRISQKQIQNIVNQKLPFQNKSKYAQIEIKTINVTFAEKNIIINFKGNAKALKQTIYFDIYTQGKLIYQNGAFYFNLMKFDPENINLQGFDFKEKEIAPKFLKRKVSLKISREMIESSIKTAIVTASSWYLNNHPVYKLPQNIESNAVRMLLTTVEVNKQEIVAHISFWNFTKYVTIYLVCFVLAIILGITALKNPEIIDHLSWFS